MNSLKANLRVLVDTVEVSVTMEEDDLTLRVEIFESLSSPNHYSARIWRIESYRLQSTFPQVSGAPAHQPSDEMILKEFEGFESPVEKPAEFADRIAARDYVLEQLSEWLRTQGGLTR